MVRDDAGRPRPRKPTAREPHHTINDELLEGEG
jgi:hypothetical protein